MRDRKLAVRYAHALLAALPSAEAAAKADDFLRSIAASMDSSREVREVFLNPAIPRAQRKAVLDSLATAHGLPNEARNFLFTVADHGRMGSLSTIAEVFHEERQAAEGVVPATLTTAAPLGAELQDRARKALEKLTGKQVQLQTRVEPGLLGGAVARIGSMVYDGSLRTQLAKLRRLMVEE
jgi:F-type H+-transporting ATPase subunit delta